MTPCKQCHRLCGVDLCDTIEIRQRSVVTRGESGYKVIDLTTDAGVFCSWECVERYADGQIGRVDAVEVPF